jgi:hypothetical protein
MIELHVEVRNVNGEAKQVGGDFMDGGHGSEVNTPERICKMCRRQLSGARTQPPNVHSPSSPRFFPPCTRPSR